jgi:aspartate-semialdehyde dehydrogenase
VGKTFGFGNKAHKIISVADAVNQKPAIALFSAGGATSIIWAEKFAKNGTFVIDNSSAWRLDKHVPLVVPEINGDTITSKTRIIANPNCSTIQMVLALASLHRAFTIKRVVVSTYQSVTGSGMKGVSQLENERRGIDGEKAYPHPIDLNLLPHGGDFNADGYTSEEQKLVDETRKILDDQNIQLTATVVRVPVYGGHSEAVNVEFYNSFDIKEVMHLLKNMPGIVIQDDVANFEYPMPKYAQDKDAVFVGRIRRDFSQANTLNMWVVSDNLRKGAATNAVQIAELIINKKLV